MAKPLETTLAVHTEAIKTLVASVIEDHFNGERARLNETRRQSLPSFGYSVECATLHLGGLRRMGYSTALMALMEANPDALCFAYDDDMRRRLSKMQPTVADARLKVIGYNPSIVLFREALREHWNGVGHSAHRLLIFVDTGISAFDPGHLVALQKAAPQFECPYLIVLLG